MIFTAMSSDAKPYYKEYTHEGDAEYKATDVLCWDVTNCQVQPGEVLSEVGINMYIEHPDKRDPSYWWVITTPNAGYIPMAPISI